MTGLAAASPPALGRSLRALAVLLLAASSLVPWAELRGPISLDDILPLIAVPLALYLALLRPPARADPLLWLVLGFATLGVIVDLAAGVSLIPMAKGPGRFLFYAALMLGAKSCAEDIGPRNAVAILCAVAAVQAVVGLGMYATSYVGPDGLGVYFGSDPAAALTQTGGGRLVGTFNFGGGGYGMNGQAAYAAMFIPPALALAHSGGRLRWGWWAVAGVLFAALFLTYTRSTLIAMFAGTLLALWVAGKRAWVVPVVLAGVAGLLLVPGLLERFFGEGTDRPALLSAAIDMANDRPWLGHGDIDYVRHLFSTIGHYETEHGVASNTPHNSIALSYFRYGIFGALGMVALLSFPILWFVTRARTSSGAARWAALAGIVSFVTLAVQSQANNLIEVPKISIYFWALWAVLSAWSEEAPEWPVASSPAAE